MQNDKPISSNKLLKWIENNTEADGFWNGQKSMESFDALTDAINGGAFDIQTNVPQSIDDWHEDIGDVLWWKFPIEEPPYCGTPLDSDWPEYHTHWTPINLPKSPE